MVRFSPMAVVACLLCVGIFALINTPDTQRLNADDIAQKKAEIDRADLLAKQLMETLKTQSAMNDALTEADSRTISVIENLQDSIKRISEHVRESVPTREEVTRLVSTKADDVKSQVKSDAECTCGEQLADLQRQIDELKTKVASLESTRTSAAAASSYGTVSGPVVRSSGGSTGSVLYGSTGSAAVRSSGGSTGSVFYSQPAYQSVASQPVVLESQPVVVSETVVTSDGCYIDANGNQVCPQRSQATRSRVLFPNARWNQ